MKPRVKQKINLTVQRLGIHGEGIAYWHGFTVFVDHILPDEVIEARLVDRRKRFGRALATKRITTSPHRVTPPCPLFEECGGCQLMHLSYDQQLVLKRQRVIDAFERIAKFASPPVNSCCPSPDPLHYRNKIQLPFKQKEGKPQLGLYARNSHDLIDVEHCHIHCQKGESVYTQIRQLLLRSKVVPFDPVEGSGEFRYLLIKSAVHTGEVLVVFVTASNSISKELNALAQEIMAQCPEVKGVVHNANPEPDNSVLGEFSQTLAGQDSIEENLCGLFFKVSPASFFQVNADQAENLYHHVLKAAAVSETDIVLDAYCGVGTLSLLMAQTAHHVIGIECVQEAVADARANAQRNGIENVEFLCTETETFIQSMPAVDVAVLNPPRKGCEAIVLQSLADRKVKRVVYVSCDPATLARDCALLCGRGYRLESATPFDMFPQTAHVECVAVMAFSDRFYR